MGISSPTKKIIWVFSNWIQIEFAENFFSRFENENY